MKEEKEVQIWVHPNFARTIKVNAKLHDMKIKEYTKKISENFDELLNKKKKVDEDKKFYNEHYKFNF